MIDHYFSITFELHLANFFFFFFFACNMYFLSSINLKRFFNAIGKFLLETVKSIKGTYLKIKRNLIQ